MAIEKRWAAIAPIAFSADGTTDGVVTLPTTKHIHTKQKVYIQATAQAVLLLEVKTVLSATQLVVGPINQNLSTITDISAYTVAAAAFLYAPEQPRPAIPLQEIERAVFEEEPVVAIRSYLVDDDGDSYDTGNPLPVLAILSDTSPQHPIIYRIDYPLANVEMSQVIPDNTKQLSVSIVGKAGKMRLAYVAGGTVDGVGASYVTVEVGCSYDRENIKLIGKTLYFQTNKNNVILELEAWY